MQVGCIYSISHGPREGLGASSEDGEGGSSAWAMQRGVMPLVSSDTALGLRDERGILLVY